MKYIHCLVRLESIVYLEGLYLSFIVKQDSKKQQKRRLRLIIESDDNDADNAKFNTPVKLGKKVEPLAPCCSVQC